jgi:uncharacterized protein YndB with AHSA1/START domain
MTRPDPGVKDTPSRPDHVLSIHIAAPVERVWEEITRTGRVQPALYNTVLECDLEPGSRLRYYSPDRERVFIIGEVVEVDPPRLFSHTYWFTTWKGGPSTFVTWELAEEGDGCRVTLTHSGWTEAHAEYEKTSRGWAEILELLKHRIETGRLPLKSRVVFRLMGWLSFLLPKRTRTEYVDRMEPPPLA